MLRLLLVACLVLSLLLSGCATATPESREDAAPWAKVGEASPKAAEYNPKVAEDKEEPTPAKGTSFWQEHPILMGTCIGLGIGVGVVAIAVVGGAVLIGIMVSKMH